MTEHLPSWPTTPPTYGSVVLRAFTDDDVHLAFELGDDPHIPLIGSLPALPTAQQALEWIYRQRGRFAEGKGLSFAIADAESDNAVGASGLWLQNMSAGSATVGYSVAPAHRGPQDRQQCVEGTDRVHLDHPHPAPDRAVHRAVEQQLKSRCRGVWFPV